MYNIQGRGPGPHRVYNKHAALNREERERKRDCSDQLAENFPRTGEDNPMGHLEAEFSKDNCPSCPLVNHLGTNFILKIAENYKPAVDAMQTSGPGSAVIEDS